MNTTEGTGRRVARAAMAVAFLFVYAPVAIDLERNWARDPNYSHGFFILPIVALLVWKRRDRLAATPIRPAMLGLPIVLGSLVALLIGTGGVEFFLMRTSAIGVIAGTILFLAGWAWFRVLLFPLAVSLLMIPLPAIVFYQLAVPLQAIATRFGVATLEIARIPVLREGNVIQLAHTSLEVAEACSGIRSLISLFALAVLYGYFVERRTLPRVLIALSSVPIAIVANGVRIAGTGIAAQYFGPSAATGFFHSFSGTVIFVSSLMMLAGFSTVLHGLGARPVIRPADGGVR